MMLLRWIFCLGLPYNVVYSMPQVLSPRDLSLSLPDPDRLEARLGLNISALQQFSKDSKLSRLPGVTGLIPWPNFPFKISNILLVPKPREWLYFTKRGRNLSFLQKFWLELILTEEKLLAFSDVEIADARCRGFKHALHGVHVELNIGAVRPPLASCAAMMFAFTSLLYTFPEIEVEFRFGLGTDIGKPVGRVRVWVEGGTLLDQSLVTNGTGWEDRATS